MAEYMIISSADSCRSSFSYSLLRKRPWTAVLEVPQMNLLHLAIATPLLPLRAALPPAAKTMSKILPERTSDSISDTAAPNDVLDVEVSRVKKMNGEELNSGIVEDIELDFSTLVTIGVVACVIGICIVFKGFSKVKETAAKYYVRALPS